MTKPVLKACIACLGRGRLRARRCPVCKGSGKVFEEPTEKLVHPEEGAAAVHVLALICPNCGRIEAPTEEAKQVRYRPADLRGEIYCAKCYTGRIEFETETAP